MNKWLVGVGLVGVSLMIIGYFSPWITQSFLIGMVGVAVASVVTYIANIKLQNRARSYEIAREIYAPLLNILRQAESDDLNRLGHKFSIQKWDELRNNRLFYWVKEDIDKHLFSFQVNLHNFNRGLIASINKKIKPQMKNTIFKRIKEEKLDQLQRTQPLVSEYFWNELAKIVLQSKEIGFLGGVSTSLKIKQDYEGLKKDFKKNMPFYDFVKGIASKFKDDPLLKEVKDEQKKLFGECWALQDEIRGQMGIKRIRWG